MEGKSPRQSYLGPPQTILNLICKVLGDQHLVFQAVLLNPFHQFSDIF